MRRKPLECGLSIFRYDLPKFWTFATRLDAIGRRYGQIARLAEHWARTYGDRFITVEYEELAADCDGAAARLAEVCGLGEASALERGGREPLAATISAVQVREPIRPQPARAGAYERFLEPLRTALAAACVDPVTGALRA